MSKTKINLIGNTFTHLTHGNRGYSVHGKISKRIEWVFDNSIGINFYIDRSIDNALYDNISGVKYGWLLESKPVIPDIVEKVKNNYKKYFNTFKYIFTNDKELLDLDDRFKWCPTGGYWIKDAKLYPKSKMISFITSNKSSLPGHKNRLNWVEMLKEQVDVYGRGFNEIELKEQGLCDYMFSVSIENAVYETFFTEKILDCFATGTIPVYLGAPDIGDHFNTDGILELKEEFYISEDLYYNKIDAIKDNLERVKKFEVLEDFICNNYDII